MGQWFVRRPFAYPGDRVGRGSHRVRAPPPPLLLTGIRFPGSSSRLSLEPGLSAAPGSWYRSHSPTPTARRQIARPRGRRTRCGHRVVGVTGRSPRSPKSAPPFLEKKRIRHANDCFQLRRVVPVCIRFALKGLRPGRRSFVISRPSLGHFSTSCAVLSCDVLYCVPAFPIHGQLERSVGHAASLTRQDVRCPMT